MNDSGPSKKRIPLTTEPQNRDTSTGKDSRLVNGYVEKRKDAGGQWVCKRPCLLAGSTVAANQAGFGVYNWKGDIYSIFGSRFYKNGVDTGGVDATGGVYTFSACLGATPQLFLQNGIKAYVYDSGGGLVVVTGTDPDYPTATVKGQAYLDGTTYVMTSLASIQGSDLNAPSSWDAANVLIAQIEPDGGVALAKQLVYVIAFKEWSTEVFYDKANAVGSPLGTVQGAKVNFGCRIADSVQDVDGVLFWISQTRLGAMGVMKLEGLKSDSISTPAIERLLQSATYTTTWSWAFHLNGHKFYGFTLPTNNLTLVYDATEKEWSQWTDTAGDYWPVASMTFDSQRRIVAQHTSNGKLYYVDAGTFQDDSALISVKIYTPGWDGEIDSEKAVNRLTVIGDQVASSTLDVSVSDDDYQTWSTARTFDLSQEKPFFPNWGSFYRRAHYLHHRANTAMRLEAIELEVSKGSR